MELDTSSYFGLYWLTVVLVLPVMGWDRME